MLRIIFLGTPDIAVPTLERLIAWPKGEVVGVVTQSDKPAGRGNKLQSPPVKLVAQTHNIPILQPQKLSKEKDIVEAMKALKPDVLVMIAFGQILKKDVLEMATHGVINIHASLLPKYRGPAPINWAIINGDTVSGVTTMFTDAGVDTGAMLLKKEVAIGGDTDSLALGKAIAETGADLIIETLEQLVGGTLKSTPQDDTLATKAPMLSKELGQIDWRKPASDIHNLVRGLLPWPGTATQYKDAPLKILKTRLPLASEAHKCVPGLVVSVHNKVLIACGPQGEEVIELVEVQPANRAKMKATDWANGARLTVGSTLGTPTVLPLN